MYSEEPVWTEPSPPKPQPSPVKQRRAVMPVRSSSTPRKLYSAANVSDGEGGDGIEEGSVEDDIDPNEPTYCICERVSFGEMIGIFMLM